MLRSIFCLFFIRNCEFKYKMFTVEQKIKIVECWNATKSYITICHMFCNEFGIDGRFRTNTSSNTIIKAVVNKWQPCGSVLYRNINVVLVIYKQSNPLKKSLKLETQWSEAFENRWQFGLRKLVFQNS